MSVLRAPDPTLIALPAEDWLTVCLIMDEETPLRVAHRAVDGCGAQHIQGAPLFSWEAAYIAVPCRECFPDAPLPGHPTTCDAWRECTYPLHPYLAWQVPS